MTVLVDPKIQEQYDRTVVGHRAASAAIGADLRSRQREIAERIASAEAERAARGKDVFAAEERSAFGGLARNQEDNDLSARAEDYQEPDEDAARSVERTAVRQPGPAPAAGAGDEEDVPSFQWDDDPQPAQPPAQPPAAPPVARPAQVADEDLSQHEWLE